MAATYLFSCKVTENWKPFFRSHFSMFIIMFRINEIHFTFSPRTAPPPPELHLRLRLLFRPVRLPPAQHLLPGLPLGLLQAQGRGEEAGEAYSDGSFRRFGNISVWKLILHKTGTRKKAFNSYLNAQCCLQFPLSFSMPRTIYIFLAAYVPLFFFK